MLSSDSVKVIIGFIIICGILALINTAIRKKDNNLKSRKNRMTRQPLVIRDGRVVMM